MEKRLYIAPQVELTWWNTQNLMQVAPESDLPPEPAPVRREPKF